MRHSKGKTKSWYPFWTDKWLWGSTRHELIVEDEDGKLFDLRGIYVDLLTLSKKDDGFIRANETTPYPHEQLAGMFCVPLERLKQCIEICLHPEVEKLREPSPGIYYIPSTADYELSEDYIRRISPKNNNKSEKAEQCTEKAEPIIEYNKIEDNRIYKDMSISSFKVTEKDFEKLWLLYPNRQGRKEAFRHFLVSVKTEQDLKDITTALNNYRNSERVARGYVQNGKTWFNNWRDWITSPEVKLYPCKFCGEMFAALNTHQSGCNKNPQNRTPKINELDPRIKDFKFNIGEDLSEKK